MTHPLKSIVPLGLFASKKNVLRIVKREDKKCTN